MTRKIALKLDVLPVYSNFNWRHDLKLMHRYERSVEVVRHETTLLVLSTEAAINSGVSAQLHNDLAPHSSEIQHYQITADLLNLIATDQSLRPEEQIKTEALSRFQRTVQDAITQRASDIHFNIGAQSLIKFRINGELITYEQTTSASLRLFLRTLYVAFSDNKAEPIYKPNLAMSSTVSGRFHLPRPYIATEEAFEPREVEVTVRKQSFPLNGSDADEVWRLIINDDRRPPNFAELGYTEQQAKQLTLMIDKPKGLILVCGTTGSGKSMTLASMLHQIDERSGGKLSIRTIEAPVEFAIKGARQWSLTGNNFAEALRTYMRADPDVICVGEINNSESALAAANASLTGHLTATTLHASTPADALTRLKAWGVDNVTMADPAFIAGIVTQTLIKLLCTQCKTPWVDSYIDSSLAEAARNSGIRLESTMIQGLGCDHCGGTGYATRTVIARVSTITSETITAIRDERYDQAFEQDQTIAQHAATLLDSGQICVRTLYKTLGQFPHWVPGGQS